MVLAFINGNTRVSRLDEFFVVEKAKGGEHPAWSVLLKAPDAPSLTNFLTCRHKTLAEQNPVKFQERMTRVLNSVL